MGIEEHNQLLKNQALTDSVNEATERYHPRRDFEGWIKMVGDRFVQKKVQMFPMLCKETMMVNRTLRKNLEDYGNKGKYTNTYGWSNDKSLKVNYSIPKDLNQLMTNMFDKRFWEHDNDKIWRPFLEKIIRGDQPSEIWSWVKSKYGKSPELLLKTDNIRSGYGTNNTKSI